MDQVVLFWDEIESAAMKAANQIIDDVDKGVIPKSDELRDSIRIYPVPRGGFFAAQAVQTALAIADPTTDYSLTNNIDDASIIIDDLIDSGETLNRHQISHPLIPFYALYKKSRDFPSKPWLVFPWESSGDGESAPETIQDNITRILQYVGEDPEREGLKDTPARVARAWKEMTQGYGIDLSEIITTFEDIQADEMIILRDIEFSSTCEHHLLPFVGKAHIGYVPDKRVVGISKLARLLEIYAKRLQIQERICHQVTESLDQILNPLGSACVIESKHYCMICRGVKKQNSVMVTSSLTGVFKTIPEARQEFLQFIKG